MDTRKDWIWLVENYLPDFEKRCEENGIEEKYGILPDGSQALMEKYVDFINENFSEALLEILKKQREECARVFQIFATFGENSLNNVFCTDIAEASRKIIDAPFPDKKLNLYYGNKRG
jgi:hypothetical protein